MHYVNVPLLLPFVLLLAYGSVVVWSATSGMSAGSALVQRHLLGLGIGLAAMMVAWSVDYRRLTGWIGPLWWATLFLVISPRVPLLGATAKGATSWLEIGGIRLFQPSEPAKLLFIIVMAAIVSQYRGSVSTPREVGRVVAYMSGPLVLILVQPDLGTGLVFVAITMGMLLVGGMKGRWFVVFGLVGVLLVSAVLSFGLLEPYQENRLLVFVDPARDPRGAGYNLAQSKIAIGSGGLNGNGLGTGTQGNLNFLPERHTDFVFAVLGEELGFVGAIGLLGLYGLLMLAALEVAASSKDLFGSLIAVGVMSMWVFQVLVNVGMTIGIMPITGIPLPFMSFGSSFMVTNFAATGMLLSVWARRHAA